MNCPKCGNEMSLGWMIPGKICQLEWAPERAISLSPQGQGTAQTHPAPGYPL